MINFKNEVIESSKQLPIVVDFWAPWCAPCRVLGPVIEEIAQEQVGSWKLVKINTEEQPEVAAQYNIRSIPNVKMFYRGDIVAEFAGALPKTQILRWLEDHLPSDEKEKWHALEKELKSQTKDEAQESLEKFIGQFPEHLPAKLALTRKIVFNDPARANALIANIKVGQEGYDLASDVHAYTELISLENDASDHATKLLVRAQEELQKGKFDQGIEHLIEAVKIDKGVHRELPRRASIAVFRLLGNAHTTTKKYRRLFDMALY